MARLTIPSAIREAVMSSDAAAPLCLEVQIDPAKETMFLKGPVDGGFKNIGSAVGPGATPSPSYFVVRRTGGEPLCIVAFVPDGAPVKLRMLYGSSGKALGSDVGCHAIVQAADRSDLEPVALDEAIAHRLHRQLGGGSPAGEAAMLPEEVDRRAAAAAEATEVADPRAAGGAHQAGVACVLAPAAAAAISRKLSPGESLVLRLSADGGAELDGAAVRAPPLDDVARGLPELEPRYVLYRVPVAAGGEGAEDGVGVMLYVCPDGAQVRQRMTYSAAKAAVGAVLASCPNSPVRTLQFGAYADVTTAAVAEYFAPPAAAGTMGAATGAKVSSRPKPPGRGAARLVE